MAASEIVIEGTKFGKQNCTDYSYFFVVVNLVFLWYKDLLII